MAQKKPFKILTSDILIADTVIAYNQNEDKRAEIDTLVKDFKLRPGDKIALNKEQFEAFSSRIEGLATTIYPGGSSANTTTTLNNLLGPERVDATFLGVAGEGTYSNIIRKSLRDSRVKLIPHTLPAGSPSPQTAVSFVVVFDDGQRAIATYPGNAKDIIKKNMITDEMVKDCDALLVQGSLWQKLDRDVANELLIKRWAQNKELFLCLPTHAKFGEENADIFQYFMPSANLVLANDDELAITCKTMTAAEKELWTTQKKDGTVEEKRAAEINLEAARLSAREIVRDQFANISALPERPEMNQKQVAFVTRGEKGISVITKDGIEDIPAAEIDKITNTLGAGDTCFAGIIAGHIQGLSNKQCAEMGGYLAREKLSANGARLANPRASLERGAPHAVAKLFADEQVRIFH